MKVRIELDNKGHGQVMLDGVDIASKVQGFTLETNTHLSTPPRLTLVLVPDEVVFVGEARVVGDDLPHDPAEWLASLGQT